MILKYWLYSSMIYMFIFIIILIVPYALLVLAILKSQSTYFTLQNKFAPYCK